MRTSKSGKLRCVLMLKRTQTIWMWNHSFKVSCYSSLTLQTGSLAGYEHRINSYLVPLCIQSQLNICFWKINIQFIFESHRNGFRSAHRYSRHISKHVQLLHARLFLNELPELTALPSPDNKARNDLSRVCWCFLTTCWERSVNSSAASQSFLASRTFGFAAQFLSGSARFLQEAAVLIKAALNITQHTTSSATVLPILVAHKYSHC